MEWSIRISPRGWVYQQLRDCARATQAQLALCVAGEARGYPESEALRVAATRRRPWHLGRYGPLGSILGPNLVRAVPCAARAQTAVNLARVACSLEGYRRQHGRFPERLADLVPQYLDQLPQDLVNGRPLQYHLTEEGRFLLYSVGWDRQDDLGRVAPGSFEKGGDWVWCYPR